MWHVFSLYNVHYDCHCIIFFSALINLHREQGHGDVWSEKIVPGMKQAILCVLQCTQDQVEHRKVLTFTHSMRRWLITDVQSAQPFPWLLVQFIHIYVSQYKLTRSSPQWWSCRSTTAHIVLDLCSLIWGFWRKLYVHCITSQTANVSWNVLYWHLRQAPTGWLKGT